MTDLVVVGAHPETTKVAAGLGLPVVDAVVDARTVVVVTGDDDIAALEEAVHAGVSVAAAVALRLAEAHVLALYDLGLPVGFGFCDRAALDAAIAAAPDADARAVTATLAAIEHAMDARVTA